MDPQSHLLYQKLILCLINEIKIKFDVLFKPNRLEIINLWLSSKSK